MVKNFLQMIRKNIFKWNNLKRITCHWGEGSQGSQHPSFPCPDASAVARKLSPSEVSHAAWKRPPLWEKKGSFLLMSLEFDTAKWPVFWECPSAGLIPGDSSFCLLQNKRLAMSMSGIKNDEKILLFFKIFLTGFVLELQAIQRTPPEHR